MTSAVCAAGPNSFSARVSATFRVRDLGFGLPTTIAILIVIIPRNNIVDGDETLPTAAIEDYFHRQSQNPASADIDMSHTAEIFWPGNAATRFFCPKAALTTIVVAALLTSLF